MENEIYDRKEDGMAGEMVDEKDNGEDNIMLKIMEDGVGSGINGRVSRQLTYVQTYALHSSLK